MPTSLNKLIAGSGSLERSYKDQRQWQDMDNWYRQECALDERRADGVLSKADIPVDRSRFMARPYEVNDAEFDVFWQAFDFNVGKESAHKAWKRLHPNDREAARKIAALYAEANPDKRYRKSPASWLTCRGWEDEIVDRSNRAVAPLQYEDMAKAPSLQFYPGDWQRDTALKMCSLAARGLWVEMMWLMFDGDPYGHLSVKGSVIPPVKLGVILGVDVTMVTELLSELERYGVFSRTPEGIIYSRRMVEDHKRREINTLNGNKGGNPKLKSRLTEGVNHSTAVADSINTKKEDGDFESVWAEYGCHGNKVQARKAWGKLTDPDKAAFKGGVAAYVASTYVDGRFPSRKHFATFANNRGWEDAIPVLAPSVVARTYGKAEADAEMRRIREKAGRDPVWGHVLDEECSRELLIFRGVVKA